MRAILHVFVNEGSSPGSPYHEPLTAWVPDVVSREDRGRIRAANAGANLALIRSVAVSLLRRAPDNGREVTKRLKAGWDDDYLLRVHKGMSADGVR
jgi:hypothetical protein